MRAGAFDLVATDDARCVACPIGCRARQRELAADFVARFSSLAASAPWQRFTLEVNPLKLGADAAAAVDGLLLLE